MQSLSHYILGGMLLLSIEFIPTTTSVLLSRNGPPPPTSFMPGLGIEAKAPVAKLFKDLNHYSGFFEKKFILHRKILTCAKFQNVVVTTGQLVPRIPGMGPGLFANKEICVQYIFFLF